MRISSAEATWRSVAVLLFLAVAAGAQVDGPDAAPARTVILDTTSFWRIQ